MHLQFAKAIVAAAATAAATLTPWKVVSPPPGLGRYSQTSAVSCPSSDFCMVAGSGVATRQGSTWHARHPLTRHANRPAQPNFLSVSCVSATDCTVVGQEDQGGPLRPLAEHWNGHGWRWEPVATMAPAGWPSWFNAVSCPTTTACVAVGQAGAGTGGRPEDARAELWRSGGSGWRVLPIPHGFAALSDVACRTADRCVAVGAHQLDVWNGSRWTDHRLPLALVAVAWASPTRVVALGASSRSVEATVSGTALRSVRTAVVTKADVLLRAVSCDAARSCTAVGSTYPNTSRWAAHWNGTSWQTESTPEPTGWSLFAAVACPSARYCMAVGWTTPRALRALVEVGP